MYYFYMIVIFFFPSRRRHTRLQGDWSSDVCSSDLRGRGFRVRPDSDFDVRLVVADEPFDDCAERYGTAHGSPVEVVVFRLSRSEERRVGRECRCDCSCELCTKFIDTLVMKRAIPQ